jgi:hypothetical protein
LVVYSRDRGFAAAPASVVASGNPTVGRCLRFCIGGATPRDLVGGVHQNLPPQTIAANMRAMLVVSRTVNEKSLELNVLAELLPIIRSWPGCSAAFFLGMRQDQESRNGIDALLSGMPSAMHLALQFKSAIPTPRDQDPYKFTINVDQNARLNTLASTRPNSVYYVFPRMNWIGSLRAASPHLLSRTRFEEVASFARLVGSPQKTHRASVPAPPAAITVNSDPFEVLGLSFDQLQRRLDLQGDRWNSESVPEHLRGLLLTSGQLLSWYRRLPNTPSAAQLLRGFGSVVIPS